MRYPFPFVVQKTQKTKQEHIERPSGFLTHIYKVTSVRKNVAVININITYLLTVCCNRETFLVYMFPKEIDTASRKQ
jgi:hypothetical protein